MHQFIADTRTWQPDLSITEPKIRAESQKQRRPKHEGQTRNTEIRGITLMDSDCLSGHIHDYFVIAAAHGFLLCRLVPLQFGPLQTHEKKISKSENFFCQLSFKRMEEEKRRRRRGGGGEKKGGKQACRYMVWEQRILRVVDFCIFHLAARCCIQSSSRQPLHPSLTSRHTSSPASSFLSSYRLEDSTLIGRNRSYSTQHISPIVGFSLAYNRLKTATYIFQHGFR